MRFCICTAAWETYCENSVQIKQENWNLRSRRLVSKNELPNTYLTTQSTR